MLAVHWRLSAFIVEARPGIARIISATLAANIHHAVLSVLLAECGRHTARDIKIWSFRAGFMQATLTENVYHAVLSMLLAESGRPTALDIKFWSRRAGPMQATLATNVYHTDIGMLLAVHWCPSTYKIEARALVARIM